MDLLHSSSYPLVSQLVCFTKVFYEGSNGCLKIGIELSQIRFVRTRFVRIFFV